MESIGIEEIWEDLKGYEGIYLISNLGKIKKEAHQRWSVRNNCYSQYPSVILKQPLRRGYPSLELTKNGKGVTYSVHRLLANQFIPNPENKKEVNHINGIRTDNRIENLEWVTRTENALHSVNVLRKNVGESHSNRKITFHNSLGIRKLYQKRHELKITVAKIGEMYGISGANVCSIGKNKTWALQ